MNGRPILHLPAKRRPPDPEHGSADALAGAVGAGTPESNNDIGSVPQPASPFATRRTFLIWALSIGAVPPERLTERILQELADEVQP